MDYEDNKYHSICSPKLNELLSAQHEKQFPQSISNKQWPGFLGEQVVGNLPLEMSRFTYYTIVHGVVTAEVVDMNYLFIFHYLLLIQK